MERPVALLALLAASVIWGGTFVVVGEAVQDLPVFHLLACRFSLAALCLWPFARKTLAETWRTRGAWLLGAVLFAAFVFQTAGLVWTTPSRSAFLTALSVPFVPLLRWLWRREGVAREVLLGLGLVMLGQVLLYSRGLGAAAFGWGDLLTLLGAVGYAVHILLAERLAQPGRALALTFMQSLVVALLAAPSLLLDPPTRAQFTPSAIGAILFTGILASGVAFSCQLFAQQRLSAVETALILTLEPVVASAFSVAVGVEPLALSTVVGGSLLLAGVVLSQLRIWPLDGEIRKKIVASASERSPRPEGRRRPDISR